MYAVQTQYVHVNCIVSVGHKYFMDFMSYTLERMHVFDFAVWCLYHIYGLYSRACLSLVCVCALVYFNTAVFID